jgi:putative ABC transport system permease protein
MRPAAAASGGQPGSTLRPADVASLAAAGMRARPARAALSAAGIALGIATMVAVPGISGSSRAQLVAEIDALGTNLLTVTPGQSPGGQTATLPAAAPAMVARIGSVTAAAAIADVNARVYRTEQIPAADSDAITVYSVGTGLLRTVCGHMTSGRFLTAPTARFPAVVLGADTASALGIDRADGSVLVWLGGHLFSVTGTMAPVRLAPELDRTALIGFGVARRLLHAAVAPAEIYVRASPPSVPAVRGMLAATADPAAPQDVVITDPADALAARADAAASFRSLFLALGVSGAPRPKKYGEPKGSPGP